MRKFIEPNIALIINFFIFQFMHYDVKFISIDTMKSLLNYDMILQFIQTLQTMMML